MASFVQYLPINPLSKKRMTCFTGNFDVPTFQQMKGKDVVALVREQFENCYDSFGVRKPGRNGFTWTWMDAICKVEEECGNHPHLQYLKACWHSGVRSSVRRRLAAKAKHEENQQRWEEGGQSEAYFKKYPYGGPHAWFLRAVEKRTGMSCQYNDALELYGVEDKAEEVTEFIQFVQKPQPCLFCRRRNCGEICDWLCRPLEHEVVVHEPPPRSVMLLYKLRVWIKRLREYPAQLVFAPIQPGVFELEDMPTRRIWRRPFIDERDFVDVPLDPLPDMMPEMEDERGESLQTVQSNNVVLTEENPSAPSIATTPIDTNWQNKCSSDIDQNFSYLTDRFTLFKSFKWTTSDLQGAELTSAKMELPCDFINTQINSGNMAMFVPFKVHRYASCDLHIKIHINSNKFQSGQLQFSWQYMEKYDVAPFQTIYGRSQLPHVIVNAGSSNEATLIIPYKYINPYIPTRKRKDTLEKLYIGTLRCFVISQLAIGDNVDNNCNFSVFIKFANAKFNGMIDGGIGEPEMMPVMAAMVASKAVDKMIGDSNGDNPTSKQVPNYLVPTASHSWSLGSGLVEPLHNLRLNANAAGVGRSGIDNSETVISVPCRTFGMLKHVEWSANETTKNKTGTCLWSCDAHPQLEKSIVWKTADAGVKMATYQLPPLSVVSGLYQYWRGSLEFRFDIVCTQFHTGRLLIAYIPGAYDKVSVSLEQARNSPHAEFSLQDSASFTFIVPYISDKPWWWRKYSGPQRRADTRAPSRVYLFVLNELIHIKAITDVVRIIPYVRAGTDFEVSVPVQPAIGLSYITNNLVPKIDCAYGMDGYNPVYITYDSAVFDKQKYCLQHSIISAARFIDPLKLKPNEYAIYSLDDKIVYKLKFKVGDKILECKFIILVESGAGYSYALPFSGSDEDKARKAAKAWKEGRVDDCKKECYDYVEKGEEAVADYNPCWIPKVYSDAVPKKKRALEFEPQMEDRYDAVNLLQPTSSLPGTGFGNYTFNENFSDLKDLMRRYQLYATQIVKPIDQKKLNAGDAICRFPVIPTGLELDVNNTSPIWNSMREGAIPVIMNGYIFFRGSIRFRVVISSVYGSITPACIWVQHHPDMPLDDYSFKQGAAITNKDRFKNHNYAYYIQTINVNNIIEFEVPFYQPSMYGFLRRSNAANIKTDLSDYLGLGDIIIGVSNADIIKSLQLDIYYSIGDDFSISTFRGFDPVVFCNEVFPEMADEYEEECMSCSSFDCNCLSNSITPSSSFEKLEFEPEMWAAGIGSAASSMFGSFVGLGASKVAVMSTAKVTESARQFIKNEVNEAATPHVQAIRNELQECRNMIDDKVVDWAKNQAILTAFGNLTHVLINPSPRTIAVAVANILISFISGSVQILTDLIGACSELFSRTWCRFSGEGVRGNAEPQATDDEITPETRSIIAILFTGVCGLVGVTCTEPKGYFPLMRDINMTAMLSNNIITFLKNSSEAIASMIKYATSLLNPRAHLDNYLDQQLPTIKKWFDEVEYLTDARMSNRLSWDRRMSTRVFDAAHIGQLIVSKSIDKHLPGGKILWDSYDKISKLRNDMVQRGVHPDVRYEPFSFWFAGRAGIGKSHLTANFVNQLARSIHYTSDTPLVYNITPGLKHWSGVQHPFALVSDDMFQVGGENLEQELANLFVIMSSCTLNPPMAAVEEKNKRLNPYVYVMHSNFEFPNLGNVMRCKEAVYRRRKLMVRVELLDRIAEAHPNFIDASELTPEELGVHGEYSYLTFSIADNPRDENTAWGPKLTYQQFLAICRERFTAHHQRETQNFTARMDAMYNLSPDYDADNVFNTLPGVERQPASLTEQIEILRQRVNEIRMELNDPQRQPGYCEQIGDCISRWFGNEPQAPDTVMEYAHSTIWFENMFDSERVYRAMCEDAERGNRDVAFSETDVRARILMLRQRLGCVDLSSCMALWKSMLAIDDTYFDSFKHELNCNELEILDLMYYHIITPTSVVNGTNSVSCFKPATIRRFATFLAYFVPEDEHVRKCVTHLLYGSVDVPIDFLGFEDCPEPSDRGYINSYQELAKYLRLNLYVQMNVNRGKYFLDWVKDARSFSARFPSREQPLNAMYESFKGLWYWMNDKERTHEENIKLFDKLFPTAVMCNCGRALYGTLAEPKSFEYCHYSNRLLHTDCFGLRRVINLESCGSPRCPIGSKLFRSLFRIVYNQANPTKHQIPMTFVTDPGEDFRREYPNWVERSKSWWKMYISPTLSYVVDFLLYVLPGVLAIAAAFLAAKAYTYVNDNWSNWFSNPPPSGAPESNNYFKFDAPKAAPKIARPRIIPKFVPSAAPQSLQTSRPAMANTITNNMVVLSATWFEKGERRLRNCTCLMLYGTKMLVLRHYMEEYTFILNQGIKPTFTLYYQTHGKQCEDNIHINDLFADGKVLWAEPVDGHLTSNFGVVSLPSKTIRAFKNIISKLATLDMHERVAGTIDMYCLGETTGLSLPVRIERNHSVMATETSSEVLMDRVYVYSKQSKGLCGSVIVSNNLNAGAGAIIGIHVAGNSSAGWGMAEPIYREMFEEIREKHLPDMDIMPIPVLPVEQAEIQLDSNVFAFGAVPPQFAHKESGVSKIIPSMVAGQIFPVRTEVNPLRPNDPRQPAGSHPLRDGCRKHGDGYVKSFDPNLVKRVEDNISDMLVQVCKPVRAEVKPLTLQQAICGDVDIPYFESLNWKSSEGFPLSTYRPATAHDKRWLFELSEGRFGYQLDGIHASLQTQLNLRDEAFKKNIKPPTIYVDCLKDYRLSPEKCKIAGKTRIFSIAPIQCSIDIRKHINDFTASFKNNRIYNSCGIGINPDSYEWTKLVHYLHEVSDKIITLDYSNFGPCLMSQLVASASNCIVNWFKRNGASEEHVKRVDWLLRCDILNPVHLAGDLVYQTINGIASGSPLTGECNSIPNLYYMKLTYLEIMEKYMPNYATPFDFDQNVRLVVYGDDLIMSVNDKIVEYFNGVTIAESLAEHGIKVTSAQKDQKLEPYGNILNATFLKRSFKPHPTRKGIWLAPVEVASVEECVNWIHKCDDEAEATLENMRSSLDLAFGHGPEYFEQHRQKLVDGARSINKTLYTKSWFERDREIFDEPQQQLHNLDMECKLPSIWYAGKS